MGPLMRVSRSTTDAAADDRVMDGLRTDIHLEEAAAVGRGGQGKTGADADGQAGERRAVDRIDGLALQNGRASAAATAPSASLLLRHT